MKDELKKYTFSTERTIMPTYSADAYREMTKFICKECNTDKLIIFTDDYGDATSIKCPNCEWKLCIHEG